MARYNDPVTQYNDDSGDPLVSGFLYFYESGTTTFKDTYKDSAFTIKNTNPVELGGAGRIPNIFLDGNYRVVLTTKNGLTEQIWERDPVFGSNDVGQFADWDIQLTYNRGDVVKASDDNYYQSITDGNLGLDPISNPSSWEQLFFITVWNTNQTYSIDNIVQRFGFLYRSITSSNQGNPPESSPTEWEEQAPVTGKNLLFNPQFRINQRGVSGSVILLAGEYGHDRFRAGSGGCTYTFATSANVTTITISAGGTLEQEIEGTNIASGTHVLTWTGAAEGQIDGGGFAASGVTATLTGGTNAIVEFDDSGPIELPQLEEGDSGSGFDYRSIGEELALCQRFFNIAAATMAGTDSPANVSRTRWSFPVEMRATPTIVFGGGTVQTGAIPSTQGLEISISLSTAIIGAATTADSEL